MGVRLDIDGAVATVTLERPEALNALDVDSLRQLRAHLVQVREDDAIHVAVLTGAGRAFCVGADLKGTLGPMPGLPEAIFKSVDRSATMGLFARLLDLGGLDLCKPLIAAVNGHCLGGGLELALQCDIRLASSAASFGLPEACVGSIPGVMGVQRLMKAVGSSRAMHMALTGERIDASLADACGLVTGVCAPEDLLPRAHALANRIAANGPLAVQAIKRLVRQTAHLCDADAQAFTELYWGVLRESEDRNEGRRAFSEKRPPVFRGR